MTATYISHDLSGTVHDVGFGFNLNPAGQITTRSVSNPAYVFSPPAGSTDYSINGRDEIVSANGTTFAYDANRNLTGDGARTHAYDPASRLTASGGATYTYDPQGRLHREAGPSTDLRFGYAGVQVLGAYDASGGVVERYVPGAGQDETAALYMGPGTDDRRWLLADERGSTIAQANVGGAAVAINRYDEYGVPSGANIGRLQYTGQMWLAQAGLYHYRARAYDPRLGRFMQTDPIGMEGGINLYAYVGNDPVNRVDPLGLADCEYGICLQEIVVTASLRRLYSSTVLPEIVVTGVRIGRTLGRVFELAEQNAGHEYETMNLVCRRELTGDEGRDLISRYAVPSNDAGQPRGDGRYLVTNAQGFPGGWVSTEFSSDGLTAANTTTPVHVFVGTISREVVVTGGATYVTTRGFGNAGRDPVGFSRDINNQRYGPGIFNQIDSRATAYARQNFQGC